MPIVTVGIARIRFSGIAVDRQCNRIGPRLSSGPDAAARNPAGPYAKFLVSAERHDRQPAEFEIKYTIGVRPLRLIG
jgi:hypothetical protein